MQNALIRRTAEAIRTSETFTMRQLGECIIGHYCYVKNGRKLSSFEWLTIRHQVAEDFGLTVDELRHHPLFQLSTPCSASNL